MGAYIAKEYFVLSVLEGNTIVHGNAHFPNEIGAFHSFYPQGWMGRIDEQNIELLVRGFLYILGQFCECFLKWL